ncbi:hypothetical protein J437_LFUL001190 [Ladona fulva]|uniref:Uncharacterized protein n=1 Tax=Ladona fulva TaxID=123851 RepID=A0A8K0JVV4_LADFU|nr:hypothetical protein J437_LFUL001190 [Ladona fulva]
MNTDQENRPLQKPTEIWGENPRFHDPSLTVETNIAACKIPYQNSAPRHRTLCKPILMHISVVPQSSYSPGLFPCDISLLPSLKKHLKGRLLEVVDIIQKSW